MNGIARRDKSTGSESVCETKKALAAFKTRELEHGKVVKMALKRTLYCVQAKKRRGCDQIFLGGDNGRLGWFIV